MNFKKPKVIIYSDYLLGFSDTFIRAQASALRGFEPVYFGSRRIRGIDLENKRVHILNHRNFSGECREYGFKATGFAPQNTL